MAVAGVERLMNDCIPISYIQHRQSIRESPLLSLILLLLSSQEFQMTQITIKGDDLMTRMA